MTEQEHFLSPLSNSHAPPNITHLVDTLSGDTHYLGGNGSGGEFGDKEVAL